MAHIMRLSLLPQTKVCAAAIELKPSGTLPSGLYIVLHFTSLWLRMCNLSITLTIDAHALCRGGGKGRSFAATFNPSTWHMLS